MKSCCEAEAQPSTPRASLSRPEQKATEIQRLLADIYARLSGDLSGHTASYIPELAQVNPDDFGIILCNVDGRIYEAGESRKLFTIQSISQPFAYGLALQSLGLEWMHRHHKPSVAGPHKTCRRDSALLFLQICWPSALH
ncbi:MAG: glutaminase [Cyanobacteriota bacterium]|nr:glutaminase [Cyanobacteriota bacterium]